MSRYSEVTRELVRLSIKTRYVDDCGVSRNRYLEWGLFGLEGSVDLSGPWFRKRDWWKPRAVTWRFNCQYWGYDPNDNENIYALYFAKNAPYRKEN